MIFTTPEFDVLNVAPRDAIMRVEIDGYSRVLTTKKTGVSGQYDWITNIGPSGLTINDMDGGADLGELDITVADDGASVTADMASFTFEGKRLLLYTGFVGLDQTKWLLKATYQIYEVDSSDANATYTFKCTDNKQDLTKVVYQDGDDGFPTDSNHPKTLNGHPLDILLDILINQVGYSVSDINLAKIWNYRDGVYAGVKFTFSITTPPAAKDFIEQQIMKVMGAYLWVNSLGEIDVNFFYPDKRLSPYAASAVGCFVDGSGVIIGSPFPVRLKTVLTVPTGAVALQVGVDDNGWSDNIGAWDLTVNGVAITVTGKTRPWNSSSNPTFTIGESGSSSPVSTAVTAGTTITIIYTGQTVQVGSGFPFVTPIGIFGTEPAAGNPATFAHDPFTRPGSLFSINQDNIVGDVPVAEQARLINQVSFRFDKDNDSSVSDGYLAGKVLNATASQALYGQFGQVIIESDGLRSGFQGSFLSLFVGSMIFTRYANKQLVVEGLVLSWKAVALEPGDIVDVTLTLFPDRIAGVKGVTAKLFEVMDCQTDYMAHTVTVKLLSADFLEASAVDSFGFYVIASSSTPAYTSASTDQKTTDMFMCNGSDQYSNGDAAHRLA